MKWKAVCALGFLDPTFVPSACAAIGASSEEARYHALDLIRQVGLGNGAVLVESLKHEQDSVRWGAGPAILNGSTTGKFESSDGL